jgi:hypothetical protein
MQGFLSKLVVALEFVFVYAKHRYRIIKIHFKPVTQLLYYIYDIINRYDVSTLFSSQIMP